MIHPLSKETIGKIRSNFSIVSSLQCIEELVLNSIDANSSLITIRVKLNQGWIKVTDNGLGVSVCELELIGKRYYSSKNDNNEPSCSSDRPMHGYCGESLASIAANCQSLEIESRQAADSCTYHVLLLRDGTERTSPRLNTEMRPGAGTTVTVRGLFKELDIRRSVEREAACRTLKRLQHRLQALAVSHPRISFNLRDDEQCRVLLDYRAAKNSSLDVGSLRLPKRINSYCQNEPNTITGEISRAKISTEFLKSSQDQNTCYNQKTDFAKCTVAISSIFGRCLSESLITCDRTCEGSVSAQALFMLNVAETTPDMRLVFVNRRPIDNQDLHQPITKHLKGLRKQSTDLNPSADHIAYAIFIECPTESYTISVESHNRVCAVFEAPKTVTSCVLTMFDSAISTGDEKSKFSTSNFKDNKNGQGLTDDLDQGQTEGISTDCINHALYSLTAKKVTGSVEKSVSIQESLSGFVSNLIKNQSANKSDSLCKLNVSLSSESQQNNQSDPTVLSSDKSPGREVINKSTPPNFQSQSSNCNTYRQISPIYVESSPDENHANSSTDETTISLSSSINSITPDSLSKPTSTNRLKTKLKKKQSPSKKLKNLLVQNWLRFSSKIGNSKTHLHNTRLHRKSVNKFKYLKSFGANSNTIKEIKPVVPPHNSLADNITSNNRHLKNKKNFNRNSTSSQLHSEQSRKFSISTPDVNDLSDKQPLLIDLTSPNLTEPNQRTVSSTDTALSSVLSPTDEQFYLKQAKDISELSPSLFKQDEIQNHCAELSYAPTISRDVVTEYDSTEALPIQVSLYDDSFDEKCSELLNYSQSKSCVGLTSVGLDSSIDEICTDKKDSTLVVSTSFRDKDDSNTNEEANIKSVDRDHVDIVLNDVTEKKENCIIELDSPTSKEVSETHDEQIRVSNKNDDDKNENSPAANQPMQNIIKESDTCNEESSNELYLEIVDPNGQLLYVNRSTGNTSTTKPSEFLSTEAVLQDTEVEQHPVLTNNLFQMTTQSGEQNQSSTEVSDMFDEWKNPSFVFPKKAIGQSTIFSKKQSKERMQKFYKKDFNSLKVLGQLDKKFILCNLMKEDCLDAGLIVLIDQHAADERIRLEKLITEAQVEINGSINLKSQPIKKHEKIYFAEDELMNNITALNTLKSVGFDVSYSSKEVLTVKEMPCCLLENGVPTMTNQDLKVLVKEMLNSSKFQNKRMSYCLMPKPIIEALNSRACHGAVKFGDRLSHCESVELVKSLGACQLPFQCAHGRPSIVPLCYPPTNSTTQQSPPQLQRITKKMKLSFESKTT